MDKKGSLKISFSTKGLVVFLLVLLPNILFFITADSSSQQGLEDKNQFVSAIQNIMQMLLIFMLVFVKSQHKNSFKDIRLLIAILFLAFYYILWSRYFFSGMDYSVISSSVIVSVAMALFPAIYFVLMELWLGNQIGAIIAFAFGIAHVMNTCINVL